VVAISVDDLDAACKRFEDLGVNWKKRLTDGRMKNVAFVLDPDNYCKCPGSMPFLSCAILDPVGHYSLSVPMSNLLTRLPPQGLKSFKTRS
jgi:hypothetical protein